MHQDAGGWDQGQPWNNNNQPDAGGWGNDQPDPGKKNKQKVRKGGNKEQRNNNTNNGWPRNGGWDENNVAAGWGNVEF